jgi:hypothetical protein
MYFLLRAIGGCLLHLKSWKQHRTPVRSDSPDERHLEMAIYHMSEMALMLAERSLNNERAIKPA